MSPSPDSVSAADAAAMRRQADLLSNEENTDEGGPDWQAAVTDWVNEQRRTTGEPPAQQWWETKTETELHERARALGLLG